MWILRYTYGTGVWVPTAVIYLGTDTGIILSIFRYWGDTYLYIQTDTILDLCMWRLRAIANLHPV